jgi:hypothetical protein
MMNQFNLQESAFTFLWWEKRSSIRPLRIWFLRYIVFSDFCSFFIRLSGC